MQYIWSVVFLETGGQGYEKVTEEDYEAVHGGVCGCSGCAGVYGVRLAG